MSALSTILLVFTLASVGLAVIMILLNLFLSGRRSWIMGIVRVALTVLAAIVAVPVAKALSRYVVDVIYDLIVSGLGSDVNELLDAVSVGVEGLRVLVSLLVAVILYLFVFIFLRLFLSIVGYIVCRCVPPLRARERRDISMPLGALNGLLMTAVILAPLCGLLSMGGRVLDDVIVTVKACNSEAVYTQFEDMGLSVDDMEDVADELNTHPLLMTVSSTVGKPIFSSLTHQTLELSSADHVVCDMSLENELSSMACMGIHVMEVVDSLSVDTFGEEEREALMGVKDSLIQSEWLTHVAADGIRAMAQAWENDESLIGLSRPTVDSMVQPAFDCLIEIFATETAGSLGRDLDTVFDIVGDFMVSNLLSDISDPQQLIAHLSSSGLITNVTKTLESNDRFKPLAVEIKSLSVRLVSDMLGVDKLENGEYDELLKDASVELNNALSMSDEERDAFISEQLKNVFAQENYDVPEDVAKEVADQMMDELGQDGEITHDELRDYLVDMSKAGTLPGDFDVSDLPV